MKAALLSFSRLVADLHAGDGIRCNAVTPGPTATDAWLGAGGLAEQQGDREQVLAKVAAGRPLGRLAEPGEIADVIVFLLSERAVVRDRRCLVGRRRHRPDHHLNTAGTATEVRPCPRLRWPRARARRKGRGRLRLAHPRAGGACALAARRPLLPNDRQAAARGGVQRPDTVPARPRPHPALEAVPPPEGQDAGLHRPGGRPLPHADDPHARDDGHRAGRRPSAPPERGPGRGDRARPRHRTSAVRSRRRGRARRAAARSGRLPPQRAVRAHRRDAQPHATR